MSLATRICLGCLLFGTAAGCFDSGPVCLNPQPDLPGCSQGDVAAASPTTPLPTGTGGSASTVDINSGAGVPGPTGTTPGSAPPPFVATGGAAASGGSAPTGVPPSAAGAASLGGAGGTSSHTVHTLGAAGLENNTVESAGAGGVGSGEMHSGN